MNKRVISGVLTVLGILFIILSLVGFVPRIDADYDATSTLFVLGLVFLVVAFFMRRSYSGERGGLVIARSKKSGKRRKRR